MSENIQATTFARAVLPALCAKGSRKFQWRVFDGALHHNGLGGVRYLSPCEGVVSVQQDGFTAIKTGRADFTVVSTDAFATPVAIGDKISASFYQLRRFDAKLADGSEDPAVGGCKRFMLTGVQSQFPVMWAADADRDRYGREGDGAEVKTLVGNPYLIDLIEQLETGPSSHPLRKPINVLIDAYQGELRFVDPGYEHSASADRTQWPSILMDVRTPHGVAALAIRYNRAMDYYAVDVQHGDASPICGDDIDFEHLPVLLEEIVGDPSWIKVKVTQLKASRLAKAA